MEDRNLYCWMGYSDKASISHTVMNSLIMFHSLIYWFGRYQLRYLPNGTSTEERNDVPSKCINNSIGLSIKASLKHRISIHFSDIELHETPQDYSSAHSRNIPLIGLSTNCWEIHNREIINPLGSLNNRYVRYRRLE